MMRINLLCAFPGARSAARSRRAVSLQRPHPPSQPAQGREPLLDRASRHVRSGRHDLALKVYQELLVRDPQDTALLVKVAETCRKLGRGDEAAGHFENVAKLFASQGFYLKAVAVLQQALRIGYRPAVSLLLAGLYEQLGLLGDARRQWKQIIDYHQAAGDEQAADSARQRLAAAEQEGREGAARNALLARGQQDRLDQEAMRRAEHARVGSPLLPGVTVELVSQARDGKFAPLVGFSAELARTLAVLNRRSQHCPLIVGSPGAGKTALIHGLALRIARGSVPAVLRDASLHSVTVAALVSGTMFVGELEAKVERLLAAVDRRPMAILVIEDAHLLVGSGRGMWGTADVAALLRPALADGRVRCVATTTPDGLRVLEGASGIARCFQRISLGAPDPVAAMGFLLAERTRLEAHHGVHIDEGAIEAALKLGARYLRGRSPSASALDLLDEAAAAKWEEEAALRRVTVEDLEPIAAKMAGLDLEEPGGAGRPETGFVDGQSRFMRLAAGLKGVVYGQDTAIEGLVSAVHVAQAGLGPERRPIGSFLFTGPTGVGKTELARQLAQALRVKLLRFDMSEYFDQESVARLIGAPPGYVGHDGGGQLVSAVRESPRCVLLLDEIEKAHPTVLNAFLQIMDDARLTGGHGEVADFRNAVVIFTSNAGTREAAEGLVGFASDRGPAQRSKAATKAIELTFSPEFRNRLDACISFGALPEHVLAKITDKLIGELQERLREKKVELTVDAAARAWLARNGTSPQFGARPLGRLIQRELGRPLAEQLLFGALRGGGTATVTASGNGAGLAHECRALSGEPGAPETLVAGLRPLT